MRPRTANPPKNKLTNKQTNKQTNSLGEINKAGYTATPVACGWAGAEIEVTRSFGQKQ